MMIEQMQNYYSRRAPDYDASMGYNDPAKISELKPIIAELQSTLSKRRVLEIACGPCFWTQYVAEAATSVTATDYNLSTLEEAKKKPLPWERVTLAQADAYHLATVPGDFDGAMAVDWLAHVPRAMIDGFLQQVIERVPGMSPIIFVDQLPGPNSITGLTDENGNHIQERSLSDGSTFNVIKHFFSDDELRDIFARFPGELSIQRFPDCRRLIVTFLTH